LALEAHQSVFRIPLGTFELSVANLVANPQRNIFRGRRRLAARREDDEPKRPQERPAQVLAQRGVPEGLGNLPQKSSKGERRKRNALESNERVLPSASLCRSRNGGNRP
jgi:hypothetical protein